MTYSFPNLEPVRCSMSSSNCCFLTYIQVSPYRRQIRWSGIPISLRIFQFLVIHTVKGFSIVNKADVFLELSCYFCDPADVGNLISGSSSFSKSSLNIWKFMVHILLKPGVENFEHYFASVWDECNRAVTLTVSVPLTHGAGESVSMRQIIDEEVSTITQCYSG